MAPFLLLVLFLLGVAASTSAQDAGKCLNGGLWDKDTQRCKCKAGFGGADCRVAIKCCNIWGDPHYMTFDGAKLSFQGSCKYNLVSQCACCCIATNPITQTSGVGDFRVDVKNWKRGDENGKVSWVKYAEVQVAGNKYTLDLKKAVRVNGANVTLPYKRDSVHIAHSGRYVRIDTNSGASVQFDGRSTILVCVPQIWDTLCGICGNNNGKVEDDYRRKDGVDVASQESIRGAIIGHSWQVSDPDDAECKTVEHAMSPLPARGWDKKVDTPEYCGLIINKDSVFKKCLAHFSNDKMRAFYTSCKFDIFETVHTPTLAKEMACESLSALSAECEEIGFPVDGWRTKSKCPLKCPNNLKFYPKTSPCIATCADPEAPKKCPRAEHEGCACRPGMVLSGETCVRVNKCGCTDQDGSYHKPGKDVWFSKDCTKRFRCRSSKKNPKPEITEYPGCRKSETCKAVDGVMKCVKIPVPGGWSTWSKWSDCVKFGDNEFDVRVRARRCDNPKPKYGGTCEGHVYETQACLPDQE